MNILLISGINEAMPGGISSWTIQYIEFAKNSNNIYLVNTIGGNGLKHYIGRLISCTSQVRRFLKNDAIDIAHINDSCSSLGIIRDFFLAKMLKRKGIKIVLHFHCDIEFQISKWGRFTNRVSMHCFKRLLNMCDESITLSKQSHDYLVYSFGKQSHIIPNFLSDEFIIENTFTVHKKMSKLIFVGHVTEEKGMVELLQCAKLHPELDFEVIGQGDQNMLSQLESQDNIHCMGMMRKIEVFNELLQADVFFFPTHSEGFSIALLEAMAAGIPCIATDVGSNLDMLENKGGIVVSAKNVEEMLGAMNIISDYNTRCCMSKWNKKKVQEYYSVESVMKMYLDLYLKSTSES